MKNKKLQKELIYAVLNEDRGGDTLVTIHRTYKLAKKRFDEIVKELKENREFFEYDDVSDDDCWSLSEKHLSYDFNDSWGNIKIIKEGEDD
jgi:hypothetical protein